MIHRERVLSIRVTEQALEKLDQVATEFGLTRSATARLLLTVAVSGDGLTQARKLAKKRAA